MKNKQRRLVSPIALYVTEEERQLLEMAYGGNRHGLSSRLRDELMAVARVRLRRQGGPAATPQGGFLREIMQKHGPAKPKE